MANCKNASSISDNYTKNTINELIGSVPALWVQSKIAVFSVGIGELPSFAPLCYASIAGKPSYYAHAS